MSALVAEAMFSNLRLSVKVKKKTGQLFEGGERYRTGAEGILTYSQTGLLSRTLYDQQYITDLSSLNSIFAGKFGHAKNSDILEDENFNF